ncbi:aminotransferase class I/II-fold pyridoxal phosphate-dependent enzyme [Photobacterium alginatilyticum]|uniref:aminotransferase class I/II-fold pyridoxal phosphate-dependent enzyme n=1 Tax=Photobacterium alginatilyticum TaxID=1775171 RepID=UPI0040682B5A
MGKLDQRETPIFSSLKDEYAARHMAPFHVPGHKQGRGIDKDFHEFIGPNIFKIDVTIFEMVDGLHHPKSHIKKALALTAETFGAKESFFTVNGTSGGIQAMILSAVNPGEKMLVPRNIHVSVSSGIILSGAIPVYMQPEIDPNNGIVHGVSPSTVEHALSQHPDAKAVLVINPTYYGTSTDLVSIVDLVHSYDIPLLVDEAHGPHLCFSEQLPISAMAAGADACTQSTHKLLGALTQGSILHIQGEMIEGSRVRQVLSMLQTTSPSYPLLASLDVARKQVALEGKELVAQAISNARWLRQAINVLEGMHCFGEEVLDYQGVFAFDPTKITVSARALGLTGFQLEKILTSEYDIQVELSDFYNVLLITSYADSKDDLMVVLQALGAISKEYSQKINNETIPVVNYISNTPRMIDNPREAFFAPKTRCLLTEAVGQKSGESIMIYPPGIPVLYPGEEITGEIIRYIDMLKSTNVSVQGLEDSSLEYINIIEDKVSSSNIFSAPSVQDYYDKVEPSQCSTEIFEPDIMKTG